MIIIHLASGRKMQDPSPVSCWEKDWVSMGMLLFQEWGELLPEIH